ncbi:MAG: ferric reductase-like transmembrane domain-containing protein [Flavisolibacter sp.]
MGFSVLDVSSVLGLCALVVLSINFLLGLMLSTAYKGSSYWKRMPSKVRKIKVSRVHKWTAYVAFGLILIHPVLLVFDRATKFFLPDIAIPFHSNYQTAWTALGVISFYAVILVIITTQKVIRRRLGFRLWKNIHLVSYGTAVLMCLHGLFLDPELKNRTPDFFDGEKVICEVCLLVIVSVSVIRIHYYRKHQKLQGKTIRS